MILRTIFLFVFLIPAKNTLIAQKIRSEADLLKLLNQARADSDRVNLMLQFTSKFSAENNPKTLEYALKALELSKRINYMPGLIGAYEAVGDAYWYSYNYKKSIDNYLRELKLADSLNIPYRVAKANYNIGWIKCVQQEIFEERPKLLNALHTFEKLHDTTAIMQVCNGLASVYMNYYKKTGKLLDSANFYFRGMIFMGEHSLVRNNLVNIYGNYSSFLAENKRYNEAKFYIHKSLQIISRTKDTFSYVNSKNILASIYYHTDSLSQSKKVLDEIFPIMNQKGYKINLIDAYKTSYLIFQKEKNYQKALEYHLLFKEKSDTLNAVVFRSNLQEKESAYEIEKREENIRRLEHINEVSELKNTQNSYIMGGMGIVAILIIGFAFNLYKSNKDKQLANLKLSEQNRIIADKKHEIEQSIQYAKGIQHAMLPAVEDIKRSLPESFIIYLPKDVVSGDFYWTHIISENSSGKNLGSDNGKNPKNEFPSNTRLLIAAADCTGHGVPGSLMSIVSIDKLNHAVLSKKLTNPSQILSSVNNDIKRALKQESAANKQKDGLDIALILIDLINNTLTFSGAHRPLWLIRNNTLTEYKANKTSIAGYTAFDYLFEEQIIPLEKNDLIILSSDGYADQFGGKNGKKMMTRTFKDYLLSVCDCPLNEIEKGLVAHFSSWKGQYEQVDDVLVIGFKI